MWRVVKPRAKDGGRGGGRTSREPTLAATSPGVSPCGKLASESVTIDSRASARPPAERDVGTEAGFVERTCREGPNHIQPPPKTTSDTESVTRREYGVGCHVYGVERRVWGVGWGVGCRV